MIKGVFKNKKILLSACIIAIELVLLLINAMRFNYESVLEVAQDEFLICDSTGNYTSGFYADHSYTEGAYVATEPIFLKKGIYQINVEYNSNSDGNWHTCYTTMVPEYDITKEKMANLLYCDKIALPGNSVSTSYTSWVRYGTDYRVTMGPETDASGDGIYVLANKVTITYLKNRSILFETSKLLMFFLVIDLILFIILFKKNEFLGMLKNSNEFIIAGLLFIIAFSSYPLLSGKIYFGDDIFYHLSRIAYLADGLLSGAFPVKIQPGWDYDYGYAVGVCYGDILLYPSAILVVLGSTVQFGYKFYIFLTNVLTTFISYHAYKKISGNQYIGIFCSALFTLMGFRLHSVYTGATVGEFGAYTFLPLVILGLYEIYMRKNKNAYITLAAGITFTLGSHVLSTFILAIVVPLLCLILIEKTIKKEVILPLIKAFILTVILNLYFIVPCADYLLFQGMRGNLDFETIWENGQEIEHLLISVSDPSLYTGGWSGIGFCSLVVLTLATGVVLTGKMKEKTGAYVRILLLTFGLLFLSTNSIVYYWLKYNLKPIYMLLSNMQFTWHFLNVCCGLIVFFAAISLEKIFESVEKKHIGVAISAIIITLCIWQGGEYFKETITEANQITMYDDAGLYGMKSDEFAIEGVTADLAAERDMVVHSDIATASIIERNGTTLYVEVNNPEKQNVIAEAPLWGYRHYTAKAGTEKLDVRMSENKKVAVEIPAEYTGQIKIYFKEPWFWRLAEISSLFALVWILSRKQLKKILKKES